jgi:hypothetical protein
MTNLSAAGKEHIAEIALRHGFSVPATMSMLDALARGNGTMAQFNDPEFAGPGQWMRGGMTMVSDMFNGRLKARVDALCVDLSDLLARETAADSTPSQRESAAAPREGPAGQRDMREPARAASIFIPPAPGTSRDWWPAALGVPASIGAQDGAKYAYFPVLRRLAIDVHGTVTVFDTLDHRISGFGQEQSVGGTMSFFSQHGLVNVAKLPVVSVIRG